MHKLLPGHSRSVTVQPSCEEPQDEESTFLLLGRNINIRVRKTVARDIICTGMVLKCIEKVTVYYCGLQVVPYLTCMLCWLHVSRCSQKLKKKEWQLFPDWLPSHLNMYVFLFFPVWYTCLYEFMAKKIAKQELVASCLHFCYSFTGDEKMGRGWLPDTWGDELCTSLWLEPRESRLYKPLPFFLFCLVSLSALIWMASTTASSESSASGFWVSNVWVLES